MTTPKMPITLSSNVKRPYIDSLPEKQDPKTPEFTGMFKFPIFFL